MLISRSSVEDRRGNASAPGQSSYDLTPQYQRVLAAVSGGASAGQSSTAAWLSSHAARDDAAFASYAFRQLAGPPSTTAQADELALVRQIAASRTAGQNALAHQLNGGGYGSLFQSYLQQWEKSVSPAQAAAGAKMLQEATQLADQVTTQAKHSFQRSRPYVLDPSLPTLDAGSTAPNASYPSGHATAAYAAATVLSALMPDKAQQFQQMAAQVAYSRVYSALHFPSDVAAGAQVGVMVGAYMIKHDALP